MPEPVSEDHSYEGQVNQYVIKDNSYEGQVRDKVNRYVSTLRSENTRKLARLVIDFLIKKRQEHWSIAVSERTNEWKGGWVRSSEIFNELGGNPYTTTRLLRDLTKADIIHREECSRVKGRPGKNPVFYRVPDIYDPLLFKTREELIAQIRKDTESWITMTTRYAVATEIFKEKTGKDLTPLVKQYLKKTKEGNAEILQVLREGGIKEIDPCKKL
jgi:hypothetical protein